MTTNVVGLGHALQWTFGDRVRKVRRETGLTQPEFAARLGYSDRQVAHWEAGRNLPADIIEVARRIHREFGVLPAWTLDTDSPPTGGGESGDTVRRPRLERGTRWLTSSPSQSRVAPLRRYDHMPFPQAA